MSGLARPSAAGDDDQIVADVADDVAAMHNQVLDFNANFVQNIWPGAATIENLRERLQKQIDRQLSELTSSTQLSGEQTQRLKLTARGEVQRFMDQVEMLKIKFEGIKNNDEKMNQIWQQIHPLQMRVTRGFGGSDSLLMKVVSKTLTREQAQEYDRLQHGRRRFRYQAAIAVSLTLVENGLGLTHQQRQKLTELLLEQSPPRNFGAYDQYVINYRLSKIPTDKLKPLFDERQWTALETLMKNADANRANFLQQGIVTEEDFEVKPDDEARP
jgi:hypothetical protein